MIITMSNNEKLSHKQIMGPFWKKICLPLNHQFTFVLCFRGSIKMQFDGKMYLKAVFGFENPLFNL